MKGISIILGLILIGLVACSSGDKKQTAEESLSADIEKSIEPSAEEEMFVDVEMEEEKEIFEAEEVSLSKGPKREVVSKVVIKEFGDYKVKRGDTLLYISFKIYGDYRKWRNILNVNPGLNPKGLAAGMVIKYQMPAKDFQWRPQGMGHLIMKGETLGKISMLHYGTSKRWKDIHINNKHMIVDPDLIFAGFTLYYIPNQVANAEL